MKKPIRIRRASALLISALLLLSACVGSDETVAVQTVSAITGAGALGMQNRYAGLVVSGETAEIKKDAEKAVETVKVAEGDMVKAGDVLFVYDTVAMELKLEKLKLEYEEMQNKIASAEASIPNLEAKIKSASAADQLGYKLQIQSLQADILESNYSMNIKQREISALEADMKNIEVCSPISGRVMSVSQDSGSPSQPSDPSQGTGGTSTGSGAFITVTDITTFRVKGSVNELNAYAISEGTPVTIRSRLDDSLTWSGTVQLIDYENSTTGNNSQMYYYSNSDEYTQTSKYPFYISLDSFDGLLLGQHVYIETGSGEAASAASAALRLPAYYLVTGDDGASFVWAQNSRGKLEKRTVTTGEAFEDGTVEILSGLALTDSIAFPEDSLSAGITCVPYEETMFTDAAEAPEAMPAVG